MFAIAINNIIMLVYRARSVCYKGTVEKYFYMVHTLDIYVVILIVYFYFNDSVPAK